MMDWKTIEDIKPPLNELVVLTGPSGYRTYPKFITFGYFENGVWKGVDHEHLSSYGQYPTHWALMVNLP